MTDLLWIIPLIIGYILGRINSATNAQIITQIKEKPREWTSKTGSIFGIRPKYKGKPGVIERPSQQDIYLKENPKIAEETAVMSDVFDSLGVKR